jgi:hypothetical protein
MRRALVVLTFAFCALSSTAAFAQRYGYGWNNGPPPGSSLPVRQGLILGGSLGGGVMYQACSSSSTDCTNSLGGGAGEVHLGGMLSPTIAIMGEVAAMVSNTDVFGLQYAHVTLAAVARAYFANRFFVEGGVGFGHVELQDSNGNTLASNQTAFSLTVSGGVELIQAWHWDLNLNLREVSTFYNPSLHNLSFNVAIDWF